MSRRFVQALPVLLVVLLAFAVRVGYVLRSSGGLGGDYGYDSGVYYAAADAVIHGRLPYVDFTLLHPPVAMLVLIPAALLGRLTSDHAGFLTATVAFMVIAAANAGLVTVVARGYGVRAAGALLGGVFYAVWFAAVDAEYQARLEPLGNLFLLVALLAAAPAIAGADRSASTRSLVVVGAALSLAVSTKIWFIVPAALVLIAVGLSRSSRAAVVVAAAGMGVALVVDGPFLVLSRGVMVSRVVLDEIGRVPAPVTAEQRFQGLTSATHLHAVFGSAGVERATVVLMVVGVLVLLAACRSRIGRLCAVLALAHITVLIVSPAWFTFYPDFAAVPLALTVAIAAGAVRQRAELRAEPRVTVLDATGWLAAACAAAVAAVTLAHRNTAVLAWGPVSGQRQQVHALRCTMSDAPNGLIELDVLDSDFDHGCPNWVDVTGRTYFGPDKSDGDRTLNPRWQTDLAHYLLSGQAALVTRPINDGITPATRSLLVAGGTVIDTGRFYLVCVRSDRSGTTTTPGRRSGARPNLGRPGRVSRCPN